MTQVTHHYVDKNGKTHLDSFSTSYAKTPFVGNCVDVVMPSVATASLLCELWKQAQEDPKRSLMLACHFDDDCDLDNPASMHAVVKKLGFENKPAHLGGLRLASERDFINAAVIVAGVKYREAYAASVNEKMVKLTGGRAQPLPIEVVQAVLRQASTETSEQLRLLLTCISNHGLYRRLSWIHGLRPVVPISFIVKFVDPTWCASINGDKPYIDMANEILSEMSPIVSLADGEKLWQCLVATFIESVQRTIDQPTLTAPDCYFSRYLLRHLVDSHDSYDMPIRQAYSDSLKRYTVRFCEFVYRSWMDWVHYSSDDTSFDEKKFFFDEPEVADIAYRAAVA